MARVSREGSGFPRCEKGFRESSIAQSQTEKRKGARKKRCPPVQHTHPSVPPPRPTIRRPYPKHIANGPGAPGAACTRGGKGREGGEEGMPSHGLIITTKS